MVHLTGNRDKTCDWGLIIAKRVASYLDQHDPMLEKADGAEPQKHGILPDQSWVVGAESVWQVSHSCHGHDRAYHHCDVHNGVYAGDKTAEQGNSMYPVSPKKPNAIGPKMEYDRVSNGAMAAQMNDVCWMHSRWHRAAIGENDAVVDERRQIFYSPIAQSSQHQSWDFQETVKGDMKNQKFSEHSENRMNCAPFVEAVIETAGDEGHISKGGVLSSPLADVCRDPFVGGLFPCLLRSAAGEGALLSSVPYGHAGDGYRLHDQARQIAQGMANVVLSQTPLVGFGISAGQSREPQCAVGVAVSGGPDSMVVLWAALAWARAQKHRQVWALIVDHGLRAESTVEAQTVAQWCVAMGAQVCVLRWQAPGHGGRVMHHARGGRYGMLAWAAHKYGLRAVLTGHHQDDLLETMVMRAHQGSSWMGLAGFSVISYALGMPIVRPLLEYAKKDLLAVATAHRIPFVCDPTNTNITYARTRARQTISAWSPQHRTFQLMVCYHHRQARARLCQQVCQAFSAYWVWGDGMEKDRLQEDGQVYADGVRPGRIVSLEGLNIDHDTAITTPKNCWLVKADKHWVKDKIHRFCCAQVSPGQPMILPWAENVGILLDSCVGGKNASNSAPFSVGREGVLCIPWTAASRQASEEEWCVAVQAWHQAYVWATSSAFQTSHRQAVSCLRQVMQAVLWHQQDACCRVKTRWGQEKEVCSFVDACGGVDTQTLAPENRHDVPAAVRRLLQAGCPKPPRKPVMVTTVGGVCIGWGADPTALGYGANAWWVTRQPGRQAVPVCGTVLAQLACHSQEAHGDSDGYIVKNGGHFICVHDQRWFRISPFLQNSVDKISGRNRWLYRPCAPGMPFFEA